MKPSFSFSEICTLISLIDCRKDVDNIGFVITAERTRYTDNEMHTMARLLKIRVDRLKNVL